MVDFQITDDLEAVTYETTAVGAAFEGLDHLVYVLESSYQYCTDNITNYPFFVHFFLDVKDFVSPCSKLLDDETPEFYQNRYKLDVEEFKLDIATQPKEILYPDEIKFYVQAFDQHSLHYNSTLHQIVKPLCQKRFTYGEFCDDCLQEFIHKYAKFDPIKK